MCLFNSSFDTAMTVNMCQYHRLYSDEDFNIGSNQGFQMQEYILAEILL